MSSQKKLTEDILFSYDIILENKNLIREALNIVPLAKTNYSHVKYDYDNTRNDSVNKPLLDDMQAAGQSVGVVLTITTAKSGHGAKTKSGNLSRHTKQTAVDISKLNGIGSNGASNSTNGNSEFRALGNKVKNALVSMGYRWNSERGNDKAVLWQTDMGGNHFNHLHISNQSESGSGAPIASTDVEKPTSTGNTASTSTETNTSASTETNTTASTKVPNSGGAETFAKNIGGKILKSIMGITESFNLSSFGNNSKSLGGKIFIPKNDNVKIKSPVSGTAVDIISNSSCVNQIVIEFNHEGQPHYLEYCGIKRPSVQVGEKIFIDKVLGNTDSNVTVKLYSEEKKVKNIDVNPSDNIAPVGNIFRKKDDDDKKNNRDDKNDKDNKINRYKIKNDYDDKTNDNDYDKNNYNDYDLNNKNEYSKLFLKGYRNLKKSFYPKQKKVDEEIERIKSLLK
jgi:hypothetical protein